MCAAGAGMRSSTSSSPRFSTVFPGETTKFATGTSRRPSGPCLTTQTAPSATSAGVVSAAGEPLHRVAGDRRAALDLGRSDQRGRLSRPGERAPDARVVGEPPARHGRSEVQGAGVVEGERREPAMRLTSTRCRDGQVPRELDQQVGAAGEHARRRRQQPDGVGERLRSGYRISCNGPSSGKGDLRKRRVVDAILRPYTGGWTIWTRSWPSCGGVSPTRARRARRRVASIVHDRGSTPRKGQRKDQIDPSGAELGTVGHGCRRAEVTSRAHRVLATSETSASR